MCRLQSLHSLLHRWIQNGWWSGLGSCLAKSCKSVRLPSNASIFRAELYAISLALNIIRRCRDKDFIIFSDSMSSLQALSGFKLEIDLVQKILKEYTTLTNSGKSIVLCHVNIPGNERADAAAKSALSLPITGMKLPGCDLIPRVSNYCLREWQDIWSNCVNNKLYAIYQTADCQTPSRDRSFPSKALL